MVPQVKFVTGDGERFDTNHMQALNLHRPPRKRVAIVNVFLSKPLTGRVFVLTYSFWSRSEKGEKIGYQMHEADGFEIVTLAEEFDCQALWALVASGRAVI